MASIAGSVHGFLRVDWRLHGLLLLSMYCGRDAWDLSLPGMYHEGRWDTNYLGLGVHFVG